MDAADTVLANVECGVDYDAIDAKSLRRALDEVARADLKSMRGKERYAFLINAYNLSVLDAVKRRLVRSGRQVANLNRPWTWLRFFLLTPVRVAGKRMSLYRLEFQYIKPHLRRDPRGHFALVCAAQGCPPLREGKYHGERLDKELELAGRAFLQPDNGYQLDREGAVLRLNRIMKWYAKDFGGKAGVMAVFTRYAQPDDVAWVASHLPKLKFLAYDWNLNIKG